MLAIPVAADDGLVPTLNQMGYMNIQPCRVIQSFIQYAKEQAQGQEAADNPVLDIGCAYGVASIPLAQARVTVTACDADARHLALLQDSLTAEERPFVTIAHGTIPHSLAFPSNYFQAALMSQVLHFLTPEEIVKSFERVFRWLKPGGQFFATAVSPYTRPLVPFRETYDARKTQNHPWPGIIENARLYFPEARKEQLPDYMHYMDIDTLQRVAEQTNFAVIELFYYTKENAPADFALDGKEQIGLICRKP